MQLVYASVYSWSQTDWNGGLAGSTATSTITTFTSQTNIIYSTEGQLTLDRKYPIAVMQGDQLSTGSTDLNASSLTEMKFNLSQEYDSDYYDYSDDTPTRLVVNQAGNYFVSGTLPIQSDGVTNTNRSGIEMEIYVNGVKKDLGRGSSGYMRNDSSHFYASLHLAVMLEDLSADDYIEIKIVRTTTLDKTITGTLTLYSEYVPDSEIIFTGTATQKVSGTELNNSASALEWSESIKDSGYTHSDGTNPENITLDEAGKYFVTVNVPLYAASAQRPNILGKVLLDSSKVTGGEFKQGYIRNATSHKNASIHWSGIVVSSSPSQVLSITLENEAYTGSVTMNGDKATVTIQKLPDVGIYYGTATQVNNNNEWNPATEGLINWSTDEIIDTDIFTHSTDTNNDSVVVNRDGDYLLSYNAAFYADANMRPNPIATVKVNGADVSGARVSTAYIRDTSNHNESSHSLVFPLNNLSVGDTVTIGVQQGGSSVSVDDTDPAILMLRYLNYADSGTLESNVIDGTMDTDWEIMTFNYSGTGIATVKARSDSNADMSGAMDWSLCSAISSGALLSSDTCVSDFNRYLQYQITLSSTAGSTPVFEDITINYSPSDQIPPSTNASNISMYLSSGGRQITGDTSVGNWNNATVPYFTWNAGADNEGGSGIKGYCLYLNTDSDGDPSTTSGLLTNSPISTAGTTCGFITSGTSIDLSSASYLSSAMISGSKYYLNIKAIDLGLNTYTGPSAQFIFNHDTTVPTNVAYISSSSQNFGSVNDMSFNWPSSGGSISVDNDSGILGWQYQINATSSDGWLGTSTEPTLGISYIPLLGDTYEHTLTEEQDEGSIIVGDNIIYFRTVDNAGNYSSAATYRTASLSYGGAAPTFEYSCQSLLGVTITPSTATSNLFTMTWDSAEATGENTISEYYYMVNNQPPSSLTTLESNSTLYVPTSGDTSVTNVKLTGVVRGNNTVYVVAVDSGDNYSQSNCVKGVFTLNSSLPDAPQNLTAADSSIKSEEIWRASLSWSEPDYQGTGDLTYKIQRSTDNSTWVDVSTTTGESYTDTVDISTTYYYRVGAYDTTNDSIADPTYTTSVSIYPKGTYAVAPTLSSDPEVTNITTKQATISWSTSRSADTKVQYGTSSGDYYDEEPSKSEQVTSHEIVLTNLDPGTKYYYTAKWTDEDGNTGLSDELDFTTDPAPTVSSVEASTIGLDNVLINFTVENASSVSVYYGESTAYGGISSLSTSTTEGTYSVQLTGLKDGTVYHYKLVLFDTEDEEYEFEDHEFETLPRPAVSSVKIQQVRGAAQPTVLISWNSNTDISSIVTYYPTSNPGASRDQVNVERTSGAHQMVIKGLLPNTPYSLIVKGRDKVGNEAQSDIYNFTTATDTRPPLIGSLKVEGSNIKGSASGESISQLVVTWNTDEQATSQVEFGEGTGTVYTQSTQEDSNLTYNHLVVISGLSPSKVYHLRAVSKDEGGNIATSVDTVTITPKAADAALDLVINNLTDAFGFLEGIR